MNQQYIRQFSTNEKETFEGDPYSERLKKQQATKDQQDSNNESAKSEQKLLGFWGNFIGNFIQGSESSDKQKQQQSSSQFSSTYQKPDFLQDSYDHLNKEDVGVKDDEFLPDYLVKDAPTYKRNPVSINLPWLINGAPSIDIKTRFMGEQIFSRMKLHKNEVLEHLFKIYRAVLLSSQDRDFDFLEQYCEETFYTKLRNSYQLKKTCLQTEASQQQQKLICMIIPLSRVSPQFEEKMVQKMTMQFSMISKIWVSSHMFPSKLLSLTYIIFIQIEHKIIQVYITDPKNFADPKVNKEIHKDAHRIIFRSYVQFKTGYKLYLKDKYGRDLFNASNEFQKYPENLDYTWQHVGVFETQMEPPLKFNKWSASENYMEWIQKHTFGVWKLVDLDNWLVGNPLVIPKYDVKQRAVSMSQTQSGTTSSSQPRSLNISIYNHSNATNQAAMAQENRQAMGKGFDPNNL